MTNTDLTNQNYDDPDGDSDNVLSLPNGNPEPPAPPKARKKKFRKVKVLPSEDGQFYYVAVDRKGEPLYTSETFTQRSDALRAARREHEGRSENFDYLLEYTNAKGNVIRETL